jgi:hypothetical protein
MRSALRETSGCLSRLSRTRPSSAAARAGRSGRASARSKRRSTASSETLGVHRFYAWTGSYYQYANRLATLWFLRKHRLEARLVFVYFYGDSFPDGTPCPASPQEWEALMEARRLTLGLARNHNLSAFEHHVFLNVRGRARQTHESGRPTGAGLG